MDAAAPCTRHIAARPLVAPRRRYRDASTTRRTWGREPIASARWAQHMLMAPGMGRFDGVRKGTHCTTHIHLAKMHLTTMSRLFTRMVTTLLFDKSQRSHIQNHPSQFHIATKYTKCCQYTSHQSRYDLYLSFRCERILTLLLMGLSITTWAAHDLWKAMPSLQPRVSTFSGSQVVQRLTEYAAPSTESSSSCGHLDIWLFQT